jgi:putative flavoprotein involved in K+ transport
VPVISVKPSGIGRYRIQTSNVVVEARNIVIATGFFQTPRLPKMAANLHPGLTQIHSSSYKNPDMLPGGAVLVVGSAQSGAQIAEELNLSGRKVFLSTGGAGRVPRRYRGRNIITWLDQIGFFDLTPELLPPGMSKFEGIPHVSGGNGGHTLNLHQFARDGIALLGRLKGIEGTRLQFKPDLHTNLWQADQFEQNAQRAIDSFIEANQIEAPREKLPNLQDGFLKPIIENLDLMEAGVRTVIWATGFNFDYSLVKLPVRDADGFPIQVNGVTEFPGLYFVGMPWMPSERSGMLIGVGESARVIAGKIVTHVTAG